MKRKSRNSKLMMDFIELRRDTTRFRRDAQYLPGNTHVKRRTSAAYEVSSSLSHLRLTFRHLAELRQEAFLIYSRIGSNSQSEVLFWFWGPKQEENV